MIPDAAWWPALALAALGAWFDLSSRRLPNWLCIAFAIAGASGLIVAHGVELLPWALLHAAAALVLGMLLFRFGMIGGGDAKFYAAAACAAPGAPAIAPLALLGWTSVAGLALLLTMFVARQFGKHSGEGHHLKGWEVPYGIAIAAGFWVALATA